MHHAPDLGRSNFALGPQTIDPRHDAARGIGMGGELLVARLPSRCRVVNDNVGERAADVDAHPQALHDLSPSTEPRQGSL